MPELVVDRPRCDSRKITFDLLSDHHYRTEHGWQRWYEVFGVCRNCSRSTVFILSQIYHEDSDAISENGVMGFRGTVNRRMKVEGFICIRDFVSKSPPEHIPEAIKVAFGEGATCLSAGCYNAAGAMFRLCLDLATRAMLPSREAEGLNPRTRRELGLRLPWMFDHGLLPNKIRELSVCLRKDGNDGAHAGTLGRQEAEDLLDFVNVLLGRLYAEPGQLQIAKERRERRRENSGK